MNLEDQAHKDIDKMWTESDWIIQDYEDRNLNVGLGVAAREYPLSKDNAVHELFIDSQPIGIVETKKYEL